MQRGEILVATGEESVANATLGLSVDDDRVPAGYVSDRLFKELD